MQSLTLTAAERRRVERLARDAKRTPKAMLRFVLRDGFDYCSYVVKSVNEGITSLAQGEQTYSTDEVLKSARGTAEKHGGRFHAWPGPGNGRSRIPHSP